MPLERCAPALRNRIVLTPSHARVVRMGSVCVVRAATDLGRVHTVSRLCQLDPPGQQISW